MRTNQPLLIEASNLSVLWAKVFLHVKAPGDSQPLVITLDGFQENIVVEDDGFRAEMDQALSENNKVSIDDNAYMLFPDRLWKRHQNDGRANLYDRYNRLLPRLMHRDRKNCYGTYFGRIIGWKGSRTIMTQGTNQLEHIISIWERDVNNGKHPRISALQVSCFSPDHDHTGQSARGFPCLQQISFSYDQAGLAIHALYPSQFVFDRGYGNYIGLCNLGRFMAEQMHIPLVRLNCYVTAPYLGKVNKTELAALAQSSRNLIEGEAANDD